MSYDLKISEGDLVIGSNRDLQKVEDSDKLIQDILKISLTPLGSNKFHPWYGSPISKSLVGSAFSMELSNTMASSQLRTCLENLQRLQKVQSAQQRVSAYELLAALQEVRIERNQIDPRFFSVTIKVLTNALTTIQTQFAIKPGL